MKYRITVEGIIEARTQSNFDIEAQTYEEALKKFEDTYTDDELISIFAEEYNIHNSDVSLLRNQHFIREIKE